MSTPKKPKSDSDKQKEVTAASFKRIAKALRKASNESRLAKIYCLKGIGHSPVGVEYHRVHQSVFAQIAKALDFEAATLRAMR